MSVSDLQRLVARATPRIEDVRSPDRSDFIRREHNHLTLREVVDALDALEFSGDAFVETMRLVPGHQDPSDTTAVHGTFEAVSGIRFMCTGLSEASPNNLPTGSGDEEAKGEQSEEQQQIVAEQRQRGADFFKQKDFQAAEVAYTTAIASSPRGHAELHTLYSNRSVARLKKQSPDLAGALADARRCVALKPDWPKGHFREGSCLRQMGLHRDASRCFRSGKALEPDSKDWDREIESIDQLRQTIVPSLAKQLVFFMLPELLSAWSRGKDSQGVLQVQVKGELRDLGAVKWRLVREGKSVAKAQLRFAFLDRKAYLENLTCNLYSKPADVATIDMDGTPMKVADVGAFLPEQGSTDAAIHIDIMNGDGKMRALLFRIPCSEQVRMFIGDRKEPDRPKGEVEPVLKLQRSSGFPRTLPRLLGFQSFPGDLNFPVIDMLRDAPSVN